MLVKDLIYLLQTRGNPDHEVYLTFMGNVENDEITQHFIETDESFHSVWTEDVQEVCVISFDVPNGMTLKVKEE